MSQKKEDPLGNRLKAISGDLKRYVEKRVELLLLNVGEHFSRMMAESVQKVAGILMLSGALVFLLVALALFLGDLLNNESLGYILVSIPMLVAGLLFYSLKPKSMAEGLQSHFEKEIIRAISANEEQKKEQLTPGPEQQQMDEQTK
ncbi:phage holin family protein [Halalkalibaculum sp. DA3122]|uniref:phage holin family protein n=1 Tax=unclassified Halalkalibaculum TaxID=2964617 RepID=UPI0037549DCE